MKVMQNRYGHKIKIKTISIHKYGEEMQIYTFWEKNKKFKNQISSSN